MINEFMMNKFWTNIVRYSRFIITSMLGLIFVILAPLKNLIKIKKLKIFFLVFLILFLILVYFIFKNMFVIG